jgi:hypothetical protein
VNLSLPQQRKLIVFRKFSSVYNFSGEHFVHKEDVGREIKCYTLRELEEKVFIAIIEVEFTLLYNIVNFV